jgi:hypothetical protein
MRGRDRLRSLVMEHEMSRVVKDIVDHRECAKTIRQFCQAKGISPASYFKMRRLGYGPDETRVPGTAIVRISPQAERDWDQRMEELRNNQVATLEEERRRAQAQQAGRIAARSPLHVSNRKTIRRQRTAVLKSAGPRR